jgi:hypothetical protein
MPSSKNILYSPLSPKRMGGGRSSALLLQFVLAEILACYAVVTKESPLDKIYSTSRVLFPFDWSKDLSPLNKLEEHANLLESAFPLFKEECAQFKSDLANCKQSPPLTHADLLRSLKSLYTHLTPFLRSSKNCSALLYFFVKHQEELEALSSTDAFTTLLNEMFPEGCVSAAQELAKKCRQLNLSHLEKSFACYAK